MLERVKRTRSNLSEVEHENHVLLSLTILEFRWRQVVTQLQQAVCTLKAQVADQSGFALAVRAIYKCATAQGEKDTPRLIDAKGLGCPKEFSDRDDDLPQWSMKTEAFFAGVIKESEMMLGWSAEQAAEITTELIDLEFLPTSTNVERGVRNLDAADAHSAHGSHGL